MFYCCLPRTCGIPIALAIRSFHPRWGLDAWGSGVSTHLPPLRGF